MAFHSNRITNNPEGISNIQQKKSPLSRIITLGSILVVVGISLIGCQNQSSSTSSTEAIISPTQTASSLVSTTINIPNPSNWYGTITIDNYEGPYEDQMVGAKDIWGIVDTNSGTGDTFFEVFGSEEYNYYTYFSAYIDLAEQSFEPILEDAWVLDKPLEVVDMDSFSPVLHNGALELNYSYEYEGESFTMQIFLREEGAEWDEANDPLPPSYETYKEDGFVE